MFSCHRDSRRPTTSLWVTFVVTALCLGGCALRLDTPPDNLPRLNPGQAGISAVTRFDTAISTGADAIAQDAGQPQGVRAAAGQVRDQAEQRLAALGGVWNPWPQGTPSGAQPGPTPVTPPANLADLVQMLVDNAATACRGADAAPAGQTATLLTAVCAANRMDANTLASAAGIQVPPQSATVSAQNRATNSDKPLMKIEDRDLIEKLEAAQSSLDYARYRHETAAAFLTGYNRTWALSRAEKLSWEVQELVNLGAKDSRGAQYALDFPALKDTKNAIHLVNQADADAFAAELNVIAALPPTGKNEPERRATWIDAAMASTQSQRRFGISPAQIFSQLWP